MGRWRWAAGAATVGLLLAGCGGGGDDGPEEPPATTPAASATPDEEEPEGLAAEWAPQLEAVDVEYGGDGVCAEASSSGCAEYLLAIMEVVLGVAEAMPSEDEYPATVAVIDPMIDAFSSYSDAGCVDVAAESCGVDSVLILVGAQRLGEALEEDEAGV